MRNKGFTLIELLAVIVILAIIAIIIVPTILNVVEKSRKNATISSALGYIDTVEKQLAINTLNKEEITEGTYSVEELTGYKVKVKGTSPSKGTVTINSKKIVEVASLCLNNYKVDYSDNKVTIDKNSSCKEISGEDPFSEYDAVKKVNKPQLTTGMTPIVWDGTEFIPTTANDPEWYDYENSRWANARTADGSYWVWIPRYAYKITSGYHSSTTGTIDVKFLKGISDLTEDETDIETSGYKVGIKDTSMHYFTHPTFQNGINKLGYWVAKYEATAAEGVANVYTSDGTCPIVGDNVSTKTIKVVPNVSSWRCINASNAYKASVLMKTNPIYGWNPSKVDTHMTTNLEWGGISYLSMSKYGTSGEKVYINSGLPMITGCGEGPAYSECQSTYETPNGVKASTTHNITGVYDMVGGAWDQIMSVYNNLFESSGLTLEEYKNIPSHHITKYTTPETDMLNNIGMDYDSTVYGDAMYEISSEANRYNGNEWIGVIKGSWYEASTYMPNIDFPWLARSGSFGNYSVAGLGMFTHTKADVGNTVSFRPIVSVIK